MASVALSGCLEFESTFEISDDGTVDVGIVTAIDTEQLEQLSALFGEDTSGLDGLSGEELLSEFSEDDPCGELTNDLAGFEVSTREIDEGGRVGVGCTVNAVPIAELTDLGEDSALSITQDDEGTTFELSLSGVSEITGGGTDDLGALGLSFEELIDFRFVVSAPGTLGENNATSTDGATATWVVAPDAAFIANDTASMSAVWTGSGSGSSDSSAALIIIIIVLAVLAVAAIAFLIIKRASGGGTPNEPETPAPVAPAAAGAPLGAPTTTPPPPPSSSAPPSDSDAAPMSPPSAEPPSSAGGTPPPPPPT